MGTHIMLFTTAHVYLAMCIQLAWLDVMDPDVKFSKNYCNGLPYFKYTILLSIKLVCVF